jgi:hypothetical protein
LGGLAGLVFADKAGREKLVKKYFCGGDLR